MEKKYYSSIESLTGKTDTSTSTDNIEKSFLDLLREEVATKSTSRRNFLKLCGFTLAGAALASSCENPVKYAIPYLNKPEEVTPGASLHYATSYYDGFEYNSIIVKVRDGRPIKIEGNPHSPISRGRTTQRVQASLLSLYDGTGRLKEPLKDGKPITWNDADSDIIQRLNDISNTGQQTIILSSGIISPSSKALINQFLSKFPGRHITYEPLSVTGHLLANKVNFGITGIPDYLFDKADLVVSFSADFLGTWLQPLEFAFRYGQSRDLQNGKQKLNKHYHFETGYTITGSKADERFTMKPSEELGLILQLYDEIAHLAGQKKQPTKSTLPIIKKIATELWKAKGKSIVLSDNNDPSVQLIINSINNTLGNYGQTLDLDRLILTRVSYDNDMEMMVKEMNDGKIGGLILWNCNPVYDYQDSEGFIKGLSNLKLTASLNSTENDTNQHFRYILPSPHYLESWDDAEPKTGIFSLTQPAIRNIFNTRQAQDSLLAWMGQQTDYFQFIKDHWQNNILNSSTDTWTDALQKGVFEKPVSTSGNGYSEGILYDALTSIRNSVDSKKIKQLEVKLYASIALGKGNHCNNPWLLELPDPLSKISWDNYASVSPKTASINGYKTGSIIKILDFSIPVYVQPGQADDTISIALGYGQKNIGKPGSNIGVNAYRLVNSQIDHRSLFRQIDKPIILEGEYTLAISQKHGSLEDRPIIRETILKKYLENPESGNELHREFEEKHVTLYKEVTFPGHHWGMGIDLNKCIGCSTCVIACQAENNIPVVGKEEVLRSRIMHWMRIDRYFKGSPDNPEVVYQPLLCQHCDNAPCENVCPVSATNHSNEGLNQMAYNRCVGTKYCINNCPYKVRRFNWFRYATNEKFDYNMNSDLGRMVLNPDVTVRERGVVEKCTFCVQRIQAKKLEAKMENRPLEDGEILPACVQSCPADALIFGDLNDPESKVSKFYKEPRNYHLLEELHTLPSIGYLTIVRNKEEDQV
jgi:molybdopterin-containing oxidoreductase family iron-sulfur binding subunit